MGIVQYKSTGRGFVVEHIPFAENYRTYARSHFVQGYGFNFHLKFSIV
jgi:callose synthase